MTMLTIVQDAVGDIGGMQVPSAVAGSSDATVKQMLYLLNKEGGELSTGASCGLVHDWATLQTEATFTTVATESQGLITTLAPGFRFLIDETIWNRTSQREHFGPLSPRQWQYRKASSFSGPYPEFRIVGGYLKMNPVPTAGQTVAFEFQSSHWALAQDGTTTKARFTADDDTGRIEERLLTLGLIWRWKKAKGLDYGEDFRTYQMAALNSIGRDGGKPRLRLDGERIADTVMVPEGAWNL